MSDLFQIQSEFDKVSAQILAIEKEIAEKLDISVHTVSTHLRSVYEKLHVNTNTGAVAKALREGII